MAGYKGVDPKGYLNNSDYKEWEQSSGKKMDQLSDDQIDDINDSIAAWAKKDPMGKNDSLARKLDESVLGIMKRKASKTAFSSAILTEYQPSHSSMVTVYEDGTVEWIDEVQTERFKDMRQATRWIQNLVATGRGEWWANDAKKALQWLKRVRVSSTKTSSVEVQLIKLGSTNPELRPHIRQILSALTNNTGR